MLLYKRRPIFIFPNEAFNFLVGAIYVLFGCNNNETTKYEVFAIATILGASGSAMLVTSLSISAWFIGENIGKEHLI